MRSIFSIDNPIFRAISRVGDMFILTLLWVVTSVPIITIGASTTSLFDVSMRILRKMDPPIFRGYFRAFKNNFKQSTIIWLIMLGVGILLYLDLQYWENQYGTTKLIVGALSIGLALIYLGILHYAFALQAVFNNTVKATFRTALIMALKHWPTSLSLIATSVLLVYLSDLLPIVGYCMLMFGVETFVLIYSVRLLVVFRKYNSELEDAPDESNKEPILQVIGEKKKREKGVTIKHGSSKVIK